MSGSHSGAETADLRARWDALDEALVELRGSRTADDIARRVCPLARWGCGADAVVLGTVTEGTWSPGCQDGPAELLDAGWFDGLGESSVAAEAVRAGHVASRTRPGGRRHVVVPFAGGGVAWLLQLVGPSDPRDLGVELAAAFAAALRSMMALVAVKEHADRQRFLIARLVNGIGEVTEQTLELADAPQPMPALADRDPAASRSSTAAGLSPRQREVLDLMVRGLSNVQIAERLVVTVPTVKTHVRAVLRACGAVNRSDAIARLARENAARDEPGLQG